MNHSKISDKMHEQYDLNPQWNKPRKNKEHHREETALCNICGETYVQNSRFDRFCGICRDDDDLYRFSGWAAYS